MQAVGKPSEFAFINSPSSYPGKLPWWCLLQDLHLAAGFVKMFDQGSVPFSQVPNLIAPRAAFDILGARPGLHLKNAKCPMLVVMAEEDDLNPAKVTSDIVANSDGSTLTSLNVRLCLIDGDPFPNRGATDCCALWAF